MGKAAVHEELAGLSKLEVRTCADLVGVDARSPAAVATAQGVSVWAVYKRRRRAEARLGLTLPRLHRVGRPIGR